MNCFSYFAHGDSEYRHQIPQNFVYECRLLNKIIQNKWKPWCKCIVFNPLADLCRPQIQFRCANGECISKERLCDGEADCSDASDESTFECEGKFLPRFCQWLQFKKYVLRCNHFLNVFPSKLRFWYHKKAQLIISARFQAKMMMCLEDISEKVVNNCKKLYIQIKCVLQRTCWIGYTCDRDPL